MLRRLILLVVNLAFGFLLVAAQGQSLPPLTPGEKTGLPEKTAAIQAAPPATKRVLILFPYQAHLPYSTLAVQTLQKEFGSVTDFNLDLYYEYLDLNRFPDEAYQQQLVKLYITKYSQQPIDVILVAGEGMLNFWLKHRSQILPTTPVVIYDITPDRLTALQLPPDVTGVAGVEDYTQSVNWLLQARPAVKEIVIVHGVSQADQTFIEPVKLVQQAFKGRIQFTNLSDLPLAEIKRRVATLPATSVVLYHLMFEDAAGVRYRPLDALRELTEVSAVPVISGYDQFIGTGTIGGYMYSIERQAAEAARLGLRILRDEPADTAANQGSQFIFDHLALQRYNIPLSALPPDSVIKNRQYSVWERYRPQLITIIISLGGLTLLTIFLTGLNRQLNTTRLTLVQTNRHLEEEMAERVKVETEREKLIAELQQTLATVKLLEGILPVCSFCKKIRDKDGHWQAIENYITDHSEAKFSHSFCPECGRQHYPEFFSESPPPIDDTY